MFEISWMLFVGASLVVIASPGQDMVLVMSRGVGQGALAGLVTSAGVCVGLLGHTVLATLGLGVLLKASELAYTGLKYLGAAYLVYIGVRLILSGAKSFGTRSPAQMSFPDCSGKGPSRIFQIPRWPCSTLRSCHSSCRPPRNIRRC